MSASPTSRPPPPPDSPSGSEAEDSGRDDDDDAPLSPAEVAQQQAQAEQLQRAFERMALPSGRDADAPLLSPQALASLTISANQFKQLLRSHIAATAGEPSSDEDRQAMDAELEGLWGEVPKVAGPNGEGVTFPALLAALAGGGADSEHEIPAAAAATAAPVVVSPPAGFGGHRKSVTGAVLAGQAEALRTMFMPVRRNSFNRFIPPTTSGPVGVRQKRYSESARAGVRGGGERPRAQTFMPIEDASPSTSNPNSLPTQHLMPNPPPPSQQQQQQEARKSVAAPASVAQAAAVPAAAAGPQHPSGCLDLADADWQDLTWLAQAHPAAFTSATSPSANSAASQFPDPLLAPSTTFVSASALQMCVQHYLSRWLNQHELNVIASMLKFVRGTGGGAPPAPASSPRNAQSAPAAAAATAELLTFDVLQRAVRALHAVVLAHPRSPLIDPLPAFAQAFGLLPSGSPPLDTEELLAHLNSFSVLPPEASLALLEQFGPRILHAPPLLATLAELKSLGVKHSRLERELALLSATRESLDSSHQDLSEQIPQLQRELAQARAENKESSAAVARVAELEAQGRTLKSAHDRLQKKVQSLQEDSSALRTELQHVKESHAQTETEHASLTAAHAKIKERNAALEREIAEFTAASRRQHAQDQAAISSLSDAARVQTQQYHDLHEKSSIFFRRLVSLGESSGLEGLAAEAGITSPSHDDGVIVGSLARSMAATQANSMLMQNPQASLGAEIDDVARGEALSRVKQQALEIEALKRQLAAQASAAAQREREVERLHSELESAHGSAHGSTPLGTGPASDGDMAGKRACCGACVVM